MEQVAYVAAALTAGNASDAMTPFDRSFSNYEKLSNYFGGLTSTFQLSNEVDVVDEQDDQKQAKLKVTWHLTLSDQQTNYTEQRSGDVDVKLSNASGKWKIVDFSPIELFSPQERNAK